MFANTPALRRQQQAGRLLYGQPNAVDVPPDWSGCRPWPSVAKADQPLTAKHTLATRAEDVVFPEDFH